MSSSWNFILFLAEWWTWSSAFLKGQTEKSIPYLEVRLSFIGLSSHENLWGHFTNFSCFLSFLKKGKDSDAGKDRRQENGMTEDEMVGWHHRLNGHELEQAPGDHEGQGSPVCCSPWGCKEPDMTEPLNNNKLPVISRDTGYKDTDFEWQSWTEWLYNNF